MAALLLFTKKVDAPVNGVIMKIKFEYWSKERCDVAYTAALARVCGLKCVKEKGHSGKHIFYVDWSVY